LNQADVAERVGISNEVYGRFERGLIAPRLSTLLRLCNVLRVEPNDLLLEDNEPVATSNESMPAHLRKLVTILEDADATTISRVTEVARWLQGARRESSRKARRRRSRR
ncbi:MAG TPA: helix-turn-helix transcriptional regulator, partial [Kofleriaceae bacterium]|nr:helix-turn-helix transcriptional regulator [Kofleriaceae bacterium]